MKNFFNPLDRLELIDRVQRLSPESTGKWGVLTANQAVCHMSDWLRVMSGEIPVSEDDAKQAKFPIGKQLILHGVPIPKGKGKTIPQTDPQTKGTQPAGMNCDVEILLELMQKVSALDSNFNFPVHPMFGNLTREEWGRSTYIHMDHHLKQFGV